MEVEKKKSDPHVATAAAAAVAVATKTTKNESPFFLEIDPYFNTPEPKPKRRAAFDRTKQPPKYYEREFVPENILFYMAQSPRSFESLEGEKFTALRGKRQEVIEEEEPMETTTRSQQVPNLDEQSSDGSALTNVTALKNKSTLTTTYSVTTTKTTMTTPKPKSKSLEEKDKGLAIPGEDRAEDSMRSNLGETLGEEAKTSLWSNNAVVPVEESNRLPTNVGFF
jgi:hypothetical protein